MNRLCVTAATAIILISSQLFTVAAPASGAPTLILENEFIKIIVNNQKQDLGRFAVETTLGDPKNQGDNNQSLIYGRPIPWTSYTTIRVDNNDFVFGGPSNRLSKRTGRDFQFGQLLDQVSSESEIRTGYKFGEVTVTQNLSFFRTPSTRVNDSVLIEYELSNTGKTAAMVGVRLMLDTKLGSNDGAPFRMGKQSITEETKFSKDDIYPFWQAFDNLTAPSIIAQGTLDLPEDRISPPDQLILANWGSLADSPWDVEYEQGRSFIRVGEDEKDTALAIYWMPIQIAPGQTRRVRTVYGLGGLTLSPGDLSLGLTAPAEATIGAKRELVIMAYIANTGGFDSYNTVATFKMPKGIEILQGQPVNKIGQLKVGETRQIPLRIRIKSGTPGPNTIRLDISSSTLAANQIERTISLLPPEKVSATLSISQLADLPNPQTSITQPESPLRYLAVSVALKNNSRLPIESISVTMDGSKCVVPAWFEVPTKTISSLAPGKTETLKWVFRQISPEAGSLDAAVSAFGTFQNTLHAAIPAVLSQNTVSVESSHRQLKVGEYGYLTIRAGTPGSTVSCIGNVSGNAIEFIRNTPDTWLSPALFAAHINLGPDGFRINELPIPKDRSGSVLRWHFRAATTGITQITCGDNGIPNTLQIEVIP